ncbi:DUF3817 domain-containing protein [Citricoccus nitrophenolicus]|uniref:DUF3817 domain-containing protein n=1 Tax=Citricoccus nitrophenolicus TaxID=863575 RepID=UPI0031EA649C
MTGPADTRAGTAPGTVMPGPRALFRFFATAEMITWALLILAMILKYTGTTEVLMSAAGGLHGFVFLCYAVVSVGVWVNQRWSAGRGAAAVLLAVVPFATLPFERSLARRGEPDATWRLVDGRSPRTAGFWDSLEAWVLRNVILAAILVVAAVAVVFSLLLLAGPPGEWFS